MSVEASLVASSQKRLEKPVVQRIVALLPPLDDRPRAIGAAGNLLAQQLVPEFPAKLRRKLLGDFASATSVLPLNGNDFDLHAFHETLSSRRAGRQKC